MQHPGKQAKYSKLVAYLKDEILMGRIRAGDPIPSENTLAEMFTLSRHTVRKAISILVNEGYLQSEHGRGTYCLDRSKTRNASRNIGVVTTYISEYIFPKVIAGIDSVLSDSGYSIILMNTNNTTDKEASCLEAVLDKHVEGLILEPTKSALLTDNIKYFEALDEHRVPYVLIHGIHQQLEGKSCVLLDDAEGMRLVVEYLAKLGHKKIIGIFKADDIQGISRHKGYAKALAEAGLPYDPENVIWFHTDDRNMKPYHDLLLMYREKRPMDAIACYNDQVAFRVYEWLSSQGIRVPEDISLTGFDDSFFSASCPVRITSVSHPKEKLGEAAAEVLLKLISDPDYLQNPIRRIFKPELIIKESCKARE